MNIAVLLYSFFLFVALTPNVLFRFPSKGTQITVAAVHAIVFGIIYYFTYSFIIDLSGNEEGFWGKVRGAANKGVHVVRAKVDVAKSAVDAGKAKIVNGRQTVINALRG